MDCAREEVRMELRMKGDEKNGDLSGNNKKVR